MIERTKELHISMYPWFAMGHLTSFLHLSNKLAERGHRISFFIPTKTQSKLSSFNLHPHLISFIPIDVPHVPGLPPGAETTNDISYPLLSLLMTAMDLTRPAIEATLSTLKPHFVFFDFTHWLPKSARRVDINIKTLHYCTISPATVGYLISPERKIGEKTPTESEFLDPPKSFPSTCIKLRTYEARGLVEATLKEFGVGISFSERLLTSLNDSDAIGFKTSKEMEGTYCDYIEEQFGKRVILAGPVLPEPPNSVLEEKWADFLENFGRKKVIFCAFGSECVLEIDQFQELVLGLELTDLPFLVALRPPTGYEEIESALPLGFQERVKERGIVHGGWVQQQLILRHSSVGCFVTHCGLGSLLEGLMNECQLVLVPNVGDQIINARMMSGDFRVGVEVEKGNESGLFTRESVCKAVKDVMDDESEIGKELRRNHEKWREFLLSRGLEDSYIDGFVEKLSAIISRL